MHSEVTTMEKDMKTGIELISDERQRQITCEGWTPEHDDEHHTGDLVNTAICYLERERYADEYQTGEDFPAGWPWTEVDWKPTPDDRVRELVKAGALIAAEIDRIRRIGHINT